MHVTQSAEHDIWLLPFFSISADRNSPVLGGLKYVLIFGIWKWFHGFTLQQDRLRDFCSVVVI